MLVTPTARLAAQARGFLRESGYTETRLRETLGSARPPRALDHGAFLHRTRDPSPLTTLARWFMMGGSVPHARVEETIPGWFLEFGAGHGLLARGNDGWRSNLLLLAEGPFWIPADRFHWGDDPTPPDHVLAPGPSLRALISGILPRRSRRTLDLGTGCGLLAFLASGRSDSVVATDLSPRAVAFARFGARLNNLENIECREGDAYAPVAGERFDHILCNPPFVLAPRSTFIYRDNPMLLDAFVRELARGSVACLHEGGYYQMVCEWAEVEGQPWPERLAGWFEGTGCDVWVLHGMSQGTTEYAIARTRELSLANSEAELAHIEEWLAHYRKHSVVGVHGGLITLRLRDGSNWLRIDEIPEGASEEFGTAVAQGFEMRDFLEARESDESLWETRFRLSPRTRLQVTHQGGPGGWNLEGMAVRVENGLRRRIQVDAPGAEFLRLFDGVRTVAGVVQALAEHLGEEARTLRPDALAKVRHLAENGFLDPM